MSSALFGPNQPALQGRSAAAWQQISDGLPLTALERKGVYVAGLIRHLAESAGQSLEEARHLPAYLLTIGSIETLGAVVKGGRRKPHEVAADGLAFLAHVVREDDQVVVSTSHQQYTIRDCLHRRDFTAHGGVVLTSGVALDEMLTVGLLCLLVASLDRWWNKLKTERGKQQLLANANVVPLVTEGRVVFVHDLWQPLANGALPGGELQHQGWRRSC